MKLPEPPGPDQTQPHNLEGSGTYKSFIYYHLNGYMLLFLKGFFKYPSMNGARWYNIDLP